MKRYLLLIIGLLLGANQFGWYIYIHWNVDSNAWAIASATLTLLITICGFIDRRNFYDFVLSLCILSLLINIISICAYYPGDEIGWYHRCWFFVRPICLLIGIYAMYKSRQAIGINSGRAIIS